MPPHRTIRLAINAANIDEVRNALSAGTSLVLSVKALEDLVPGKANPVVLPRGPLDEVLRCADTYLQAVGELREAQPDEATQPSE